MPEILITIKQNGETNIEGQNFKDASCAKATEAFEKALGVVKNRTKKPEYYINERVNSSINIKG